MITFERIPNQDFDPVYFANSKGVESTMILESQDLFNSAIIGWCSKREAFVYDYDCLIETLMNPNPIVQMTENQAINWICNNIIPTIDFVLYSDSKRMKPCIVVWQDIIEPQCYVVMAGIEANLQQTLTQEVKEHG